MIKETTTPISHHNDKVDVHGQDTIITQEERQDRCSMLH